MERERLDNTQAGAQLRPHLPGHGHKYGSVTWTIGIIQRLTEAGGGSAKDHLAVRRARGATLTLT